MMLRTKRRTRTNRFEIFKDREFNPVVNRCDICDDVIPCKEDMEYKDLYAKRD